MLFSALQRHILYVYTSKELGCEESVVKITTVIQQQPFDDASQIFVTSKWDLQSTYPLKSPYHSI